MKTRRWLLAFFLLLGACHQNPSPHIGNGITLVVVLSVDQMLPDYLDLSRFGYTEGFRRLYTEGLSYSNANLNYSRTLTSPGHAALSTGTYPRVSGITDNWITLRTNQIVPSTQELGSNTIEGSGPKNLRVDALGDWLTAKSRRSKVISVAGKDRSAIFMGGRRPTHAFWYDASTGEMVTSAFYTGGLPGWVKSFNPHFLDNIPSVWVPLSRSGVSHPLQPDLKRKHQESPFHDLRMLDFALQAVRSETLGQRGVPDLLLIGLSGTDHIGHKYGTESLEMQDNLIRLDHALGIFIARLESMVGKDHLLIVLTSDHGALRSADRKIDFDQSIRPSILELDASLREKWKLKNPVIQLVGTQGGFLDYAAAEAKKIDPANLERQVRQGMMGIEGISDVYFRGELTSTLTPDRPFLEQYRNSYYSPNDVDFLFRFCEKCLVYIGPAPPTQHGSPYPYDSRVPLLFWGQQIPSAQISRRVHIVDVAPTIATLLRIGYPSSVSGKPLLEVLPR